DLERLFAGPRLEHLVALASQNEIERAPDVALVVDDEDRGRHDARVAGDLGERRGRRGGGSHPATLPSKGARRHGRARAPQLASAPSFEVALRSGIGYESSRMRFRGGGSIDSNGEGTRPRHIGRWAPLVATPIVAVLLALGSAGCESFDLGGGTR